MTTKYLDSNGLLYLWQKIRTTFVSDVTWDSTNKKLVKKKKTGTNGAEESTDLVTFATVATSGSYNDLSNKPTIPTLKNVFGKVKVGSTTIEADTTQDTLELAAGSNVTLTPDATNDKVTIAATDTTYSAATTSANGLMSSSDKSKLDGIAEGAEVNYVTYIEKNSETISENPPSAYVKSATVEYNFDGSYSVDLLTTAASGQKNGVCDLDSNAKIPTARIPSGYANVQPNWNQTTTTADDYIKNKPTTMTPSSHTHGNVQNGGTLQTNDITIANGDKLVVTDSSDSSKIARASASFDGSTTTKALTQKGSFETFCNLSSSQALTNKTYNGYTLGGACAKGVVTSISSDSTDLPTVTAVKQYVSTAVSGGAAFQGTAPTTFAPTNYTSGWYWVVGTAGTYVGQTCEAGDMIFATASGTTYSASDFDVIQTNLDITAISNSEIDTIVAA